MKKLIILLSLVAAAGIAASPAQAALGFIKPDSRVYFVQPLLESIRLFFTFSNDSKTAYLFELTDRRAEELGITPQGSIADRYADHYRRLGELAESKPDESKDQAVEKIKTTSLNQQKVLARVYSQVPEQAQDAILNAQENSSKHVAKTIESVQGAEKSQEYAARVAQIIQVEKAAKRERLERAPMEGAPNPNPEESTPKSLNPIQSGQELKPANPTNQGQETSGAGAENEPVAPAPMQPQY